MEMSAKYNISSFDSAKVPAADRKPAVCIRIKILLLMQLDLNKTIIYIWKEKSALGHLKKKKKL